MSINSETLKRILKNCEMANRVWQEFKEDEKFYECFHLRPTSSGVTIVSTLPYASMRGLNVSDENNLRIKLTELKKHLPTLCSTSNETALQCLEKCEFKLKNRKNVQEDNIQALFIKGMILNLSEYENIRFVASELTLKQSERLDVIGIKENTLYIFEMKKERSLKATKQTNRYVDMINENIEIFSQIPKYYPNHNVPHFTDIRGVCVMQYAYNSTNKLDVEAKEKDIDIWYFEPSLSFRKVKI